MKESLDQIKDTFNLSDFQLKKYEAMFDCIDSGKDGYLDFADFVPHVNHIKKEKSWDENGQLFLKMMNAKASFWLVLCYIEDAILENKIDKVQWVHFWGEMCNAILNGKTFHFGRKSFQVTKRQAPGWTTVIMHSLFEVMDSNFSGIISKSEYKLYLESIGIKLTPTELDEVWNRLTEHSEDDGIRIDEMEELLTQWLINSDPDHKAPGDFFPSGGYGI